MGLHDPDGPEVKNIRIWPKVMASRDGTTKSTVWPCFYCSFLILKTFRRLLISPSPIPGDVGVSAPSDSAPGGTFETSNTAWHVGKLLYDSSKHFRGSGKICLHAVKGLRKLTNMT